MDEERKLLMEMSARILAAEIVNGTFSHNDIDRAVDVAIDATMDIQTKVKKKIYGYSKR